MNLNTQNNLSLISDFNVHLYKALKGENIYTNDRNVQKICKALPSAGFPGGADADFKRAVNVTISDFDSPVIPVHSP